MADRDEKIAAKQAAIEAKLREKQERADAKRREKDDRAQEKEQARMDRERARQEKRDAKLMGSTAAVHKKPPALLIAYIVILVFTLSGIGAYFFTKAWLLPKVHEMKVEKKLNRIRDERKSKNQIGIVEKLQSITTNTYGSSGRIYVIAEISVEAKKQEIIDEVLLRESRFRDALIRYFRSHSASELRTPEFPDQAKQEIKRIINRNLSTGWIDSVYFTKLIVN